MVEELPQEKVYEIARRSQARFVEQEGPRLLANSDIGIPQEGRRGAEARHLKLQGDYAYVGDVEMVRDVRFYVWKGKNGAT